MIQRIQTIWMLLAAVAAGLTFRLPHFIGTQASTNTTYQLKATENVPIIVLTVLIASAAFLGIFMYKQRTHQVWLCVGGIILDAVLIIFYYQRIDQFIPHTGSYTLWALLHVIIMASLLLAARAIRKDEKLVKDSDRLR